MAMNCWERLVGAIWGGVAPEMAEGARTRILEVLGSLTEREERVVRLRYGVPLDEEPMGLREIGEELGGVTKMRVSQILEKAMRRLRHPLRTRMIRGIAVWAEPMRRPRELAARGKKFYKLSEEEYVKVRAAVVGRGLSGWFSTVNFEFYPEGVSAYKFRLGLFRMSREGLIERTQIGMEQWRWTKTAMKFQAEGRLLAG